MTQTETKATTTDRACPGRSAPWEQEKANP